MKPVLLVSWTGQLAVSQRSEKRICNLDQRRGTRMFFVETTVRRAERKSVRIRNQNSHLPCRSGFRSCFERKSRQCQRQLARRYSTTAVADSPTRSANNRARHK